MSSIRGSLGTRASLRYRPDPFGSPEARRVIRDYYRSRGIEVAEDDIVLVASTSEGYSFLLKLLADPGDRIHLPSPSYPLVDFLAQLEAVDLSRYPLHYHEGWWLDLDALVSSLSERSRAVILVSPNNPTGSYLDQSEWSSLQEAAIPRRMGLVVDEVFGDYPFQKNRPGFRSVLEEEAVVPTFVLSGISKVLGLPQMKLAWIVLHGPNALRRESRARLEIVADTYLSVAGPIQAALPRLFAKSGVLQGVILDRIRRNLAFLRNERLGPISLLAGEGGWYAILRMPNVRSADEWAESALLARRLLVHSGSLFGSAQEACLVVSLLAEEGTFGEGIASLRKLAEETLGDPIAGNAIER